MGTRLNRLAEAILTSAHNLCFGAKIRFLGIPLQTPFFLCKSGVYMGILTWTCYPDAITINDTFYRKWLENSFVVTFCCRIECVYAGECQLYAGDLSFNDFIYALEIGEIVKIGHIGEVFKSVGVGLGIFGFD